ncbi:MAG: hypothetical protein RLZZ127_1922 [Planctomycetota bacterium]|jgi:uncharacterized protein (UPF0276 family)
MSHPRLGLPDLGFGIGLRTTHYRDLLADPARAGFLEIISENYLDSRGRPLEVLDRLAAAVPVVMHGVGMSIGGPEPLQRAYLRDLRRLRDRIGARWVSDHLCATGVAGLNTHDLLPIPLNAAALDHVADRVRHVQDALGAPLVLENPSAYIAWRSSDIPEGEFLAELCRRTGCGLLVDVNNLYVCARNSGQDPGVWMDAIPWDHVVQFHVAGHTDRGDLCIDTHDQAVRDEVWDLLAQAWPRAGGASVLLERDADIPPLAEVLAELDGARRRLGAAEVVA